MAGNITERMSAAQYLALVAGKAESTGPKKRMNKFGNRRGLVCEGETYDSGKELKHHQLLELARQAREPAERVVKIQRQVPFLLVEKQDGERPVRYFADFVVEYADGRNEVHDTKSTPTRADKAYIIKRKLMLQVHGIRIKEL